MQINEGVARGDAGAEDHVGQRLVNMPDGSPGNTELGLMPSIGVTNALRSQNIGRLTIGMIWMRPRTSAGSSSRARRWAAWIDTYSLPWTPAVMVTSGPSSRPVIVTYGHSHPCSTGRSDVRTPSWRRP